MNSQDVTTTPSPPPSPPHTLPLPPPPPLPAQKYNLIAWFNSHSKIVPLDSLRLCLKLVKVTFKNCMGSYLSLFFGFYKFSYDRLKRFYRDTSLDTLNF